MRTNIVNWIIIVPEYGNICEIVMSFINATYGMCKYIYMYKYIYTIA